MKRVRFSAVFLSILSGFLIYSCAPEKQDKRSTPPANGEQSEPLAKDTSEETESKNVPVEKKQAKAKVSKAEKEKIADLRLDRFPELTVLLSVRNVGRTVAKIEEAGGRIDYDPNHGRGDRIPFLVATLPPKKLLDDDFVEGLDLNAIKVDHPAFNRVVPKANGLTELREISVPIEDIKIPELRARDAGEALGEGVTVAVIDTGVDASHNGFQDRVVFWWDATQEGRVPLTKSKVVKGKLKLLKDEIDVPAEISETDTVYYGYIDEKLMGVQHNDATLSAGEAGLDINNNQTKDDRMLVVVVQSNQNSAPLLAYVDVDGDGQIATAEVDSAVIDFNLWRSEQAAGKTISRNGMIDFSPRDTSSHTQYPVLFELEEGEPKYLTLGMDLNSHGTHVSGIIAGNSPEVQGAAPKAKIMSLKVCSGITCTDAALLRGLLKAFYNDQGIVPDVVNVSLGSHQGYSIGVFDFLVRDLSAKFGTTFFISASNSGPGYRSLNGLGSLSPAVFVGAHVSRDTLREHYNLRDDVEISEQNLLFFSSVGPSYTGELKPNIVAPGSALSYTPLNQEGVAMYNGTSMSSPIAAGAAAALISKLKLKDQYQWYAELRQRKIASLSNQGSSLPYSLVNFPLALRNSLENTASTEGFDDYNVVQIGHGLIDIDAAYQDFLAEIAELKSNEAVYDHHYFQFKINNNAKASRVYERKVSPARAKEIKISHWTSGEESEETQQMIKSSAVLVRLSKIQVQSADGTIAELPLEVGAVPFSIADFSEADESFARELILGNSRKNSFTSVRHLERMESGKTYIAQYDLFQNEHRVGSLVDIVHRPIFLTEEELVVDLPSIDADQQKLKFAHAVKAKDIAASTFHRYPVAITEADSHLTVKSGITQGVGGRLLVQVYDPDGKEVEYSVIRRSSEIPSARSSTSITVPTTKKKGIYEIVVSAYSGSRMIPSRYDLLLSVDRLKVSVEELSLSKGASTVVAITNTSRLAQAVESSSITDPVRFIALDDVQIIPNYRTFKKIEFPGTKPEEVDLEIKLGLDNPKGNDFGWFGRIDHRLYKKNENGEMVEAYSAVAGSASESSKTFKNVATDESLFVATETFSSVPEDQSISARLKTVNLEVMLKGWDASESIELESIDSSIDSFLFKITAPAAIEEGYGLRSAFKATFDSGTEVKIPVTIK